MKQISGQKLRSWRKAQRRSLESLAHEIGISYITLQRWETGKNKGGVSELGYQALQKVGFRE